jgi:hypothetical protein
VHHLDFKDPDLVRTNKLKAIRATLGTTTDAKTFDALLDVMTNLLKNRRVLVNRIEREYGHAIFGVELWQKWNMEV